MAFFFDWQTFFHAGYVAFVFGVLFLGALAFRQIVDNLAVKELGLGEDRNSFLDAPAVLVLGLCWVLVAGIGLVVFTMVLPSVYAYALPLVLTVQLLQLTLRTVLQRTQVKTRGLVVRSILFGRVRPLPFDEIVMVRFVKNRVWTDVRVGLKNEEAGFRIFSHSAAHLERILQNSCSAPILWAATNNHEHRSSTPSTRS